MVKSIDLIYDVYHKRFLKNPTPVRYTILLIIAQNVLDFIQWHTIFLVLKTFIIKCICTFNYLKLNYTLNQLKY